LVLSNRRVHLPGACGFYRKSLTCEEAGEDDRATMTVWLVTSFGSLRPRPLVRVNLLRGTVEPESVASTRLQASVDFFKDWFPRSGSLRLG
jgi:hypothetical protein